jgi:hypothetical protein
MARGRKLSSPSQRETVPLLSRSMIWTVSPALAKAPARQTQVVDLPTPPLEDAQAKQFNPRVTPQFMERFAEAKAKEASRLGEDITQAYFLELLLATYERAHGHETVRPFGLSEPAFDAAKAIADHMGWSLSAVIEDAIAARFQRFSIANPADTGTR